MIRLLSEHTREYKMGSPVQLCTESIAPVIALVGILFQVSMSASNRALLNLLFTDSRVEEMKRFERGCAIVSVSSPRLLSRRAQTYLRVLNASTCRMFRLPGSRWRIIRYVHHARDIFEVETVETVSQTAAARVFYASYSSFPPKTGCGLTALRHADRYHISKLHIDPPLHFRTAIYFERAPAERGLVLAPSLAPGSRPIKGPPQIGTKLRRGVKGIRRYGCFGR